MRVFEAGGFAPMPIGTSMRALTAELVLAQSLPLLDFLLACVAPATTLPSLCLTRICPGYLQPGTPTRRLFTCVDNLVLPTATGSSWSLV